MFKNLRDKTRELMGLAKEANMVSQHNVEMDQQAKLLSLLRELDQVNVNIGHAKYMVNHFEHEWRSTDTNEDFIHNHQAMMLSHKHLIQLRAQRDELDGYINYLGSQQ